MWALPCKANHKHLICFEGEWLFAWKRISNPVKCLSLTRERERERENQPALHGGTSCGPFGLPSMGNQGDGERMAYGSCSALLGVLPGINSSSTVISSPHSCFWMKTHTSSKLPLTLLFNLFLSPCRFERYRLGRSAQNSSNGVSPPANLSKQRNSYSLCLRPECTLPLGIANIYPEY